MDDGGSPVAMDLARHDDDRHADTFVDADFDDELNDEEFEIPPPTTDSASISLEDVLLDNADWSEDVEVAFSTEFNQSEAHAPVPNVTVVKVDTPSTAGSLLKCIFLQGVSQQITTALERIDAGVGCAVSAWGEKVAIGTSHGYVMAFTCQILRWCCHQNKDQAAVSSLDYSEDGTRLLAGFARGIVCMYESEEGAILRRIEACGGGPWGVLRVCWVPIDSGPCSAVVADTGGSVWLLKFTKTLAIRSTKVSCLFSGARGEVCAIEPLNKSSDRWGGVLALATLSRVVVVWGVSGIGGAKPRAGCQSLLIGPADSLPLLAWQPIMGDCDLTKRLRNPVVLCSARGTNIQFHQVKWTTSGPKMSLLKSPKPISHKATAIRWLGGRRLAILDIRETLYLWETSANTIVDILDLSNAQLVYANAHFKGVATDGKVSEALAQAGAEALGGSVTNECITGALLLLGRTGLTRITARTTLAAAHHHADLGRWIQAFDTIMYRYKSLDGFPNLQTCLSQRSKPLFLRLVKSPLILTDPNIATATIDSCVKMELLETLWGPIWDALIATKHEKTLLHQACRRASDGLLPWIAPAACQGLVTHMLVDDPQLLQKALLQIPLECMDLHQVLSECHKVSLWSAWVRVTAATTPDNPALPLRELIPLLGINCRQSKHEGCPGDVLLLYTADCFAGRIFPMGSVSIADRPLVGQEVLRCLLEDPTENIDINTERYPNLRSLLLHDTTSTLCMLEISFSVGPFSGPLGKQKRLAMGLALYVVLETGTSQKEFTEEEIADVVSFTCNRLINGSLPADITLINYVKKKFSRVFVSPKANQMIEASWLSLLRCSGNITNHLPHSEMLEMANNTKRFKVKRFLKELVKDFDGMLETYLNDGDSSVDMFAYLEKHANKDERLIPKQLIQHGKEIASNWPEKTAQFLLNFLPDLIPVILPMLGNELVGLAFTTFLYKQEALDIDTSSKHLELLCILKPEKILEFLNDPPNALPPSISLKLIKKYNHTFAEPKCLEATGDLTNALKVAIQLILNADVKEDMERLAEDAYSLCTRAVKLSGPEEAENYWKQLIESISSLKEPPGPPLPALLLEGAAYYLPLPWLVSKICSHGGHAGTLRGALINLFESTKDNAEAMAATSRLTGTELHTALAKGLRDKRALTIASTVCGYCHKPLHSNPLTRAYYCGHAFHLECDPFAGQCGRCGKTVMEEVKRSVKIKPSSSKETPQSFSLWLVAPPRPDLEGII